MTKSVTVVGGGLAGCEAAWALGNKGISVRLIEMKPLIFSPAHSGEGLAELVCSNSFKSMRLGSAGGLLKAEMARLGSLLVEVAYQVQVPAGGALAVDRELFSQLVTRKIQGHPNITVTRQECKTLPEGPVILATGPLTSEALALEIGQLLGQETLSFYDAAAPIVEADSLDYTTAFYATRYDKGDPDYINCPFTQQEYEVFYNALVEAETVPLKAFEDLKVYEGCMPIEVLGRRGIDTLRFGPMRPVGLIDPRTSLRPYAVVQLRKENTQGSQFNLVGFQTNLKWGEQKRVFSLIPGLKDAEFARFGVMHRNTFIDSPRLLDWDFTLRGEERILFAGQITGVEGYMESAASGLIAGHSLARRLHGEESLIFPSQTMLGSLTEYISNPLVKDFQPMGANMGLLPKMDIRGKKMERYEKLALRSLEALDLAMKQQKFSV